ncbi:hypothetical protein GGI15_001762 [Coemansia interrupta]|uniref:Uncharacterized protein n=1 Tax=Coemansia interrupta TaxID=1126814 RepID=A0A9W8LNC9_9FUNG|nr:hypothetical protein GGI15_001762 [Coemansia interrupta]
MSYLQVIPADGKTDEQRFDEFNTYLLSEGVIEKVFEEEYDGDYDGIIQERIAADMTEIGETFDYESNRDLAVQRHRSIIIRNGIDSEIRDLCKELDNKIKYDLSEKDLATIKELELTADEIEDEIVVRPFCMYELDINKLYNKDLHDLPESAVDFAKLALEHEMDCAYENSEDEDEDWEDEDEDDDDDDEEDEDEDESDEEEDKDVEMEDSAESSKGKGKAAATEDDDDEDEEEHVHGEHCNHEHEAINLDEQDLPFPEDEVTVSDASTGLALLKDRKDEVVAVLEKITGSKVESFKNYHFPGRHYVVAWLKDFGVFGIRISYPMMMDDDDEELDEDEEEDE